MIKNWKQFNENVNSRSTQDVVNEYSEKYPKYADFFKDFLEYFPTRHDFDEEYRTKWAEEPEDLDEWYEIENDPNIPQERKDEIWQEMTWTPESEVHMLEQRIGNYPGDDIWVDFFEELCGSEGYLVNNQ